MGISYTVITIMNVLNAACTIGYAIIFLLLLILASTRHVVAGKRLVIFICAFVLISFACDFITYVIAATGTYVILLNFTTVVSRLIYFPIIPSYILYSLARMKRITRPGFYYAFLIIIILLVIVREIVVLSLPQFSSARFYVYIGIMLIAVIAHFILLTIVCFKPHATEALVSRVASKAFATIGYSVYIYLGLTIFLSLVPAIAPPMDSTAYFAYNVTYTALHFILLFMIVVCLIVFIVRAKKYLHEGDVFAVVYVLQQQQQQVFNPQYTQGYGAATAETQSLVQHNAEQAKMYQQPQQQTTGQPQQYAQYTVPPIAPYAYQMQNPSYYQTTQQVVATAPYYNTAPVLQASSNDYNSV